MMLEFWMLSAVLSAIISLDALQISLSDVALHYTGMKGQKCSSDGLLIFMKRSKFPSLVFGGSIKGHWDGNSLLDCLTFF